MKKLITLITIAIALLLTSCSKDDDVTPNPNPDYTGFSKIDYTVIYNKNMTVDTFYYDSTVTQNVEYVRTKNGKIESFFIQGSTLDTCWSYTGWFSIEQFTKRPYYGLVTEPQYLQPSFDSIRVVFYPVAPQPSFYNLPCN